CCCSSWPPCLKISEEGVHDTRGYSDSDRQADPEASRIILTHTNDEVRALNLAARERMRDAGDLGPEVRLTVERGERSFAPGDRVMFLQNDRGMGVKNGTLGTIAELERQAMTVRTDDGRAVRFDLKDYDRIDHGYAATIHKAQGMTVDRAHVLATPGLNAHSSYVALTRHRDGVDLHYGRDDFATPERLARTLGRERAKDMALDHTGPDPAEDFAARRGIDFGQHVPEPPEMRLQPDDLAETREAALRPARARAMIRHAEAVHEVFEAQAEGGKASSEQLRTLNRARDAFDVLRPDAWRDAEAAYLKDPSLARDAAKGQLPRAIRALQLETELRTDPRTRADHFVDRWQTLDRRSSAQYRAGDYTGYRASRRAMTDMARSLQRDPQLESLLANRKRDLGISSDMGRRLGQELAFSHGLDLGRSRGLGL
ncbi:Ti-type conjugative transfer relaxase TraA, partial [Litorisediminicola beolgyonensis]